MPLSPPAVSLDHPDGTSYALHFEPLARAPRLLRDAGLQPGPALVVTDETVGDLYLDPLTGILGDGGWRPVAMAIAPGEASKTLTTWSTVLDWATRHAPTRRTPILALGGGVVGDLAGFVAATLLRGVPLVHLPTTVLAQVDSAIGGKTGVNTDAGKNLVGAFKRPHVVIADPATLQTLTDRDLTSGLAEAVKHGLLSPGPLLADIETRWNALLDRDPDAIAHVVRHAAAVKADVVMQDEFETGSRAYLNLGHTFGHAIERATGYGTFTHGEAVALGMRAALHLSASLLAGRPTDDLGLFSDADALVARLPTPTLDLPTDTLIEAMRTDKKRDARGIRFVVLKAPGRPQLVSDVPDAFVRAAWEVARLVSR